jgi:proteasome accessory factor B
MAAVDPLERVTNLLALLLETRQALSLEEIANELGDQYPTSDVARRGAFERDKGVLRDVGVPLETVVLSAPRAGQTGYFVDRRRYELQDLQLSVEEERALQVAAAAARSGDAAFGLLKVGASAAAVSSTLTMPLPDLSDGDALTTLREAAQTRTTATFSYRGVERRLDPYSTMLRSGAWYVLGYDHAHGEVRTFRADRIDGDVALLGDQSFVRPPDFDPLQHFPSDPKELGAESAEALVRIYSPRSRVFRSVLDVVASHPDGAIDVRVACANLDAFRMWVLSLGDDAEVLSPPHIRDAIVGWLQALIEQFGNPL